MKKKEVKRISRHMEEDMTCYSTSAIFDFFFLYNKFNGKYDLMKRKIERISNHTIKIISTDFLLPFNSPIIKIKINNMKITK